MLLTLGMLLKFSHVPTYLFPLPLPWVEKQRVRRYQVQSHEAGFRLSDRYLVLLVPVGLCKLSSNHNY